MLIIALSLLSIIVLNVVFGSQGQSVKNMPQVTAEGPNSMPGLPPYNYDDPYRQYNDPYYNHNRNPVFSPDRRYVWDGTRWVSNERGFGVGLIVGLLAGIVAALYVFSQY